MIVILHIALSLVCGEYFWQIIKFVAPTLKRVKWQFDLGKFTSGAESVECGNYIPSKNYQKLTRFFTLRLLITKDIYVIPIVSLMSLCGSHHVERLTYLRWHHDINFKPEARCEHRYWTLKHVGVEHSVKTWLVFRQSIRMYFQERYLVF